MNILVDVPVYAPLLDTLQQLEGVDVTFVEKPEEKQRVLPTEQIVDCNVLFCTSPPENYTEMNALAMIQIGSAGFTQLVGKNFGERNIKACNALGVFDVPIAEWNIAMMINLARDMRGIVRNQESQVWDRSARFQSEIRGLVVGIWGYGGIGRETARLASTLGMQVHVLTRNGVKKRENIYCIPGTGDALGILPHRVFLLDQKEEFLKGLDFLIMAIPHSASTEGVVGESELRMLKREAFLLNPARGPLIKEQALLKALREGWIAGAAIDTHYYYPMPPDHPLWHFPNVIMTPHISGSSASTHYLERVWDIFVQNVVRFKSGSILLNELSPSQLNGK
ncbi:MAG: D-2-hydroxyacid dehydrogenase [Chitinophagaceae bacterium]